MSLIINHNTMAAATARTLNVQYGKLSAATQRLSSGLRVNSAADDAAGLAIRELQRADIATLRQGARNANDAISLIQTADGALQIIDEKLIRMKELAEQAATGTYDSTQRLMIDSEFQAMASEIDRIAHATDFNGIHLLDGNLAGQHDGSGLNSSGAMKIHFGTGNDCAEDYYYVEIPSSTMLGLGLSIPHVEMPPPPPISIGTLGGIGTGNPNSMSIANHGSGVIPMSFIPKGATNVVITIDGLRGAEDDIQLFTRDGTHLSGTRVTDDPATNDRTWSSNHVTSTADATALMTTINGFNPGAAYREPTAAEGAFNDGGAATAADWSLDGGSTVTYLLDGETMNITYSGDYDRLDATPNNGSIDADAPLTQEKVTIDVVAEDLLIFITGQGIFNMTATWDTMPTVTPPAGPRIVGPGQYKDISTQAKAQTMLGEIDDAIIKKDQIRAHLGALQNRLENTVSNVNIQAENLQTAESRISDTDVATEMTEFTRTQILTRSATAMLAQANSLPKMALQLMQS